MNLHKLKEILQRGEGIQVEFKTSQFELSRNTFSRHTRARSYCSVRQQPEKYKRMKRAMPEIIIEIHKITMINGTR